MALYSKVDVPYGNIWLYLVAPLVGALLAVILYNVLMKKDDGESNDPLNRESKLDLELRKVDAHL